MYDSKSGRLVKAAFLERKEEKELLGVAGSKKYLQEI